jgi:hypothetical protein
VLDYHHFFFADGLFSLIFFVVHLTQANAMIVSFADLAYSHPAVDFSMFDKILLHVCMALAG